MLATRETFVVAAVPPIRRVTPFGRWFLYLAASALFSLILPYLVNRSGRVYSPAVGTFVETPQGLQATAEHIWLDGFTAALIQSRFWIGAGLLLVALDVCFWWLKTWRHGHRNV